MKFVVGFFLSACVLGAVLATLVFVLPPRTDSERAPALAEDPICIVPWSTLARATHGSANGRFERHFDAAVSELENKEIMLQGFMIPLDAGHAHLHFRISASPGTCPAREGIQPDDWVEAIGKLPIEESDDQILVSGRLSISKDGKDARHFRLTDAMRLTD